MKAAIGNPRVLIVGAGPAGLAAAAELARSGVSDVLIIDRDDSPGGLPRFCHHPGFGLEYARWPYSGPAFAKKMLGQLQDTPVRISMGTTLLSIENGPVCEVIGPEFGHAQLEPQVVIVATGIREANRGNRVVPGVRPAQGILTTGLLQQLVHRNVSLPSYLRRLVVVGTEHVSFSAILTARHAGIRVVALIGADERVQSYSAAGWLARALGINIHLRSEIVSIAGTSERVEAVRVRKDRVTRDIACDGVLFSAGWIPETVALANGPMLIDAMTKGPIVDQAMRTSIPGVFAAGNVLRGVETSGFAALEGKRAGAMAAMAVAGKIPSGQARETRKMAQSRVPQHWDHSLPEPLELSDRWRPARFRDAYERQT
ncbi:FAD-dependent oxidoreductase [Hyphomicrobium sp.]|uniref:NAD(P)/FAD-dependent oxidoreductase n=1 Tax=Hyphomicrobium sp. TaxID=82 RepID=UPI0025B9C04B|nr:FAD-dependent oxidoreductase [Hyphomicrobium sp.]